MKESARRSPTGRRRPLSLSRVAACLLAALFALSAAPAAAAEGSWSWSKLNPFSGWGASSPSSSTGSRSATSNSTWSWKPKLWNPFSSLRSPLPAAGSPPGPSMWTRMSNSVSNTSRKAWSYTSTALQPWKWGQSSNQPLTGTRRAQSYHNDKSSTASSWNPLTWFATKQEPTEPRTVSDFMRMPRAKF